MKDILRYLSFLINLLFGAGSFLLIGFIIWIRNLPLVHDAFVEGKQDGMLLYFSIFLVAALLLTGFLGIGSVIYQAKILLKMYLIMLIIFVVIELASFIYTISKGASKLIRSFQFVWIAAGNKTKFLVQTTFNCCGYLNASEWNDYLPPSCFNDSTSNTTQHKIWDRPCSTSILNLVQDNMLILGGLILVFVLLQNGQILITVYLVRFITKSRDKKLPSEGHQGLADLMRDNPNHH